MSCTKALEGFMSMNNAPNQEARVEGRNTLMASLVVLVVVLVVNFMLGPFLWNEVMVKLVPACGKARWYDTVALSILLSLILPRA